MKNLLNDQQILSALENKEKTLAFQLEQTKIAITSFRKGTSVSIPLNSSSHSSSSSRRSISSNGSINPAIVEIVQNNPNPVNAEFVEKELIQQGFKVTRSKVSSSLAYLRGTSKIRRSSKRGFYLAPRG